MLRSRVTTLVMGVVIASGVVSAAPAGAAGVSHHRKNPPPVAVESVAPAMVTYRNYVAARISTLKQQVSTLQTDLTLLDSDDAENAWLAAHETWLKIGQDDSAYSAFGTLGLRIDGTAAGLPGGTADPKFTGFHKVELDLWTNHDLLAAMKDTQTLAGYVTKLSQRSLTTAIPADQGGVANFILRAHEVTEDMVRDTLSGADDYGSGTGLASVTADVAASREILNLLAPFLKPRAPHLVHRARAKLSLLLSRARAQDHGGAWTGVAELSRTARERIDAAADAADEILAPVPDLLRVIGT